MYKLCTVIILCLFNRGLEFSLMLKADVSFCPQRGLKFIQNLLFFTKYNSHSFFWTLKKYSTLYIFSFPQIGYDTGFHDGLNE